MALGCGDAFREDDAVMDMRGFNTREYQSHTSGIPKTTDSYIRTFKWYKINGSLCSSQARLIKKLFRRRYGD